jgi:hypothetical protein
MWPLAGRPRQCYRAFMYTVARMLQFVGLTIPLLSIFAQLNQQITLRDMLGFLALSMGIFALGYLLQRYSGGPS